MRMLTSSKLLLCTWRLLLPLVLLLEVVKMQENVTATLDCNSTLEDMIPNWNEIKWPWTCERRCGEIYNRNPCACDELCQLYNNCCEDFATFCASLVIVDATNTAADRANDTVVHQSGEDSSVSKDSAPRAEGNIVNLQSAEHASREPCLAMSANDSRRRSSAGAEPALAKTSEAVGIVDRAITIASTTQPSFEKNIAAAGKADSAGNILPSPKETASSVETGSDIIANLAATISMTTKSSDKRQGNKITKKFQSELEKNVGQLRDRKNTAPTTMTRTTIGTSFGGGEDAPVTDGALLSSADLMGKVRCRHSTSLVSLCPRPAARLQSPLLYYGGKSIRQHDIVSGCETPPQLAKDLDVLQYMPVTEAASGFHFANVYCLLCNGGRLEHSKPWSLAFLWNFKLTRFHRPRGIRDYLVLARQLQTETMAKPPHGVSPRRCYPTSIFRPVRCGCPRLVRLCETGPAGFINWGIRNFRNRHCLKCYIKQLGKASRATIAEIKPPNVDMLALLKPFTFVMVIKWVSEPVGNSTASVRIYTDLDASMTFPWVQMTCDLEDSVEPSSIEGGLWHEHELLSREDGAQTVGKAAEMFATEEPSTAGKGNTSGVEEETAKEAEALDTHNKDTTALFTSTCRIDHCRRNIPLVDGECRTDLIHIYYDIILTCLPLKHSNLFHEMYTLPADMVANFARVLRQDLEQQPTKKNLTEAYVSRSLDGCTWRITVSLLEVKASVESALFVMNATFGLFQGEMRYTLLQFNKMLHVCGTRLYNWHSMQSDYLRFILPQECTYSTTWQPREIVSAGTKIRASVMLLYLAAIFVMVRFTARTCDVCKL